MNHQSHPDGGDQQYYGFYPAIVTSLEDPDSLGRVEVRFPWLGADGDRDVRAWATVVSPYADDNQGIQMLPELDSQVVVAFEAGNLRRPYLVGACWNGREQPPEQPRNANDKRLIRSRSESVLEFDDTGGAAKLTLRMKSGHMLELSDSGQTVTLTHSNGSTVAFNAAGQIEIRANAGVEVHAPVTNVHSPTANFDGIVTCTTLIASSGVVSPSYTPGAGNVW